MSSTKPTKQYNLEMVPVPNPKVVPATHTFRLYLLPDRAINLMDQIHMISDVGKSETVADAIEVLATLIKCGKNHGFKIEDAEQIVLILEKYSKNNKHRS